MVEFETYEESRLDEISKLALEAMKDWDWIPWYPTKEELRRAYSREGFTPETRHLVYDGNELVAFLSSAVEAETDGVQFGSFHIPFIKKGYEHVKDELLALTIQTLRDRGVKAIRTTTMTGWGPMPQMLEKLGFGEQRILAQRTIFKTAKFDFSDYEKPDYLLEVDLRKDRELIAETIEIATSMPKENVEGMLNYIDEQDIFISGAIVKSDECTTFGMLYPGPKYEGDLIKRAFISAIPIPDEKQANILIDIFKFLVHKAEEEEIQLLWYEMLENLPEENYAELDLKFEPFFEYVLRLE